MSWEIICSSDNIDYVLQNHGQDEIFATESIVFTDRTIHKVRSSGYQEPDDDVMVDIYIANSDHGYFKWTVTARRSGFNSFAEVEDVQCLEPTGCEVLDNPTFVIRED